MNSDPGNDLMPLIGKLASIMTLSEDERYAIQGLPRTRRRLGAREDISREGDRPSQCCLILEGWAFRYKTLGNGNRQILSFHLPGEIPDLQGLHLRHMDHNLSTLTECTVVFIPHNGLQALISEFPALNRRALAANAGRCRHLSGVDDQHRPKVRCRTHRPRLL